VIPHLWGAALLKRRKNQGMGRPPASDSASLRCGSIEA
jgi:hypothetical protein